MDNKLDNDFTQCPITGRICRHTATMSSHQLQHPNHIEEALCMRALALLLLLLTRQHSAVCVLSA